MHLFYIRLFYTFVSILHLPISYGNVFYRYLMRNYCIAKKVEVSKRSFNLKSKLQQKMKVIVEIMVGVGWHLNIKILLKIGLILFLICLNHFCIGKNALKFDTNERNMQTIKLKCFHSISFKTNNRMQIHTCRRLIHIDMCF